jgi:hypothetical protein
MPRALRVLIEGGLYHVYNRFARGEEVFADRSEAVEFIKRACEALAVTTDALTPPPQGPEDHAVAAVGCDSWNRALEPASFVSPWR